MEPIPDNEIPPTFWTLVAGAGQGQREAVARFLAAYRQPLITHLMIRQRLAPTDAEDLVQAFMLDKIVATNIISVADKARGRFRNFLLTALDNYVRDAQRAANTDKRAPDRAGAFPESPGFAPPARGQTPDAAFDLEWARVLIDRTIARMKKECATPDGQRTLAIFQARILDPILDDKPEISYDQLIEKFHFDSPLQASNALVTAKRMFRRLLRETIAEYAATDGEIDQEINDLFTILSGGR